MPIVEYLDGGPNDEYYKMANGTTVYTGTFSFSDEQKAEILRRRAEIIDEITRCQIGCSCILCREKRGDDISVAEWLNYFKHSSGKHAACKVLYGQPNNLTFFNYLVIMFKEIKKKWIGDETEKP